MLPVSVNYTEVQYMYVEHKGGSPPGPPLHVATPLLHVRMYPSFRIRLD